MSKLSEFQIIAQYFKRDYSQWPEITCGIGDDAATIVPIPNHQLVIAIDTLVEDVHFPKMTPAYDIGYKSLAVNLSDLAAMGAKPAWATLALTLPEANKDWIEQFAAGFFDLASQYNVALIGGDTTRGPLAITVQVSGYLPLSKGLYRSGAKVGDLIYVTGPLGDAALAFALKQEKASFTSEDFTYLQQRFARPQPRVKEGLLLREFAHSAIDISDGFLADLSHILEMSKVGAKINLEEIPLSPAFVQFKEKIDWVKLALAFGDDYELCFTISATDKMRVTNELSNAVCVGEITAMPGLNLIDSKGKSVNLSHLGYEHFISENNGNT